VRSIPPEFDGATVKAIDARLDQIEHEHRVSVPWAIESGSRAWGFASPDSDYDCRFFFVRTASDYLDPWRPRDVIETPLDGLLDVNGWDLIKAVRLAVAGNATVGEWLRSPLVYRGSPEFRADLLDLVENVFDRSQVRRHYLHVGRAQWSHAVEPAGTVHLKRVFYAIRPAVTLAWMENSSGVPPMNLDELLAEVEVPDDVRLELHDLRERKSRTREMGTAPAPPAISSWVQQQFAKVDDAVERPSHAKRAIARERFAVMVERFAPNS
jgi:predicted nucleotidyltransferase